MSTICLDQATNSHKVYCKGSPEMLSKLSA